MVLAMFAMVMLTFGVGLIAFITRVKAVKSGKAKAGHFLLMNAKEYPESVIKTTRNFNLQFEIPVLFYIAGALFTALQLTDSVAIFLAWSFVIARVIHAFIHITYNRLLHRILSYWSAVLVAMGLWIYLVVKTY